MSTGWRYLAVLLIGAALAGSAAWAWQGKTINTLQADLRTARGRIDELAGVNGQCAADVGAAKLAMADLVRLDAERSAIAHVAVEAAQARADAAAGRAADLQQRPPADPANTCSSITDLRREYMKGRAAR
jgi:hypothetical protein